MSRTVRLLFLTAGAVLLLVLLSRIDAGEVVRELRRADPVWLSAAVAMLAANIGVKALRWRMMVARITGAHLRITSAVGAILAGVAAASLSPARTVDLAKPLLLRRALGVGLSTSTAAVLVERFLDGAALVALLGASLLLLPAARASQFQPVIAAAGLLVIAGAVTLASPATFRDLASKALRRLPLPERLREPLERVTTAFAEGLSMWRERRNLWRLVALSVAAALLEAARLAAVFAALGRPLGFSGAMLAFAAASLVGIVALIPGGIGITELSMAGVAALILGLGPTEAAIAGAVLLDRFLSYYLVVGVGALVLLATGRNGRNLEASRSL